MTEPKLSKLAKQGNPKAIAALINRSLKPKGITAKAYLQKNGCLQIRLESSQVPPRSLVRIIRKGLISLEIKSINRVKIYGKKLAQENPDWHEEFQLPTSTPSTLSEVISSSTPAEGRADTLPASQNSTENIHSLNTQSVQKKETLSPSQEAVSPVTYEVLPSLKTLSIRWAVWAIAAGVLSQILRFGSNYILTGLIASQVFDLMNLIYVFITALQVFSDIGLELSIIQSKRGDEQVFLNTAWTIQVVRGIVLWLCCFLIAWPVAQFYESPQLLWLLPVVGLTQLISGFKSTALYTLSRHMKFGILAIFRLGVQAVSLTVMIIWASLNPTVWALIFGSLVSALIEVVWSHRLVPQLPNRIAWERRAALDFFSFGKWILMAAVALFLFERLDTFILARQISLERLISAELLGVYGIASTLATTALPLFTGFSWAVIFPFFSRQAELSRDRLRNKMMQPRWLILLVGAAILTITISFGDLLVFTLYPKSYVDAAWMLPILSLGLWPVMLSETINPLLFAVGQPRYAAFGRLLQLIFLLIGLPLGFSLAGLVGAVIAVALSSLSFYGAITYGLQRERLIVIKQDFRATAVLMTSLALILLGRVILGFGLPIDGMFS
jgi:O-antigen/teichoic acid export membrane protein